MYSDNDDDVSFDNPCHLATLRPNVRSLLLSFCGWLEWSLGFIRYMVYCYMCVVLDLVKILEDVVTAADSPTL
jgi:hypothetical protein